MAQSSDWRPCSTIIRGRYARVCGVLKTSRRQLQGARRNSHGSKVEKVCEACSISLNRNAVHGDASALSPGGVRIGTPAMTTRGLKEDGFRTIAEFLDRVLQISLQIQKEKGKKLKDFEEGLKNCKEIEALQKDVQQFASGLGYPGL